MCYSGGGVLRDAAAFFISFTTEVWGVDTAIALFELLLLQEEAKIIAGAIAIKEKLYKGFNFIGNLN